MGELMDRRELAELLPFLSPDERTELNAILARDRADRLWVPTEGPQQAAYESEAFVVGYGGAAGGGKTDLILGSALTKHRVSYILRREATQLTGIYNRLFGIVGSRDGFNGADKSYHSPDGRFIKFGSTPHLGDEANYQGQARDLLALDEAANFLEAQVRFLIGWTRTTDPKQKVKVILAFNPPTTSEGQWVRRYFAPWITATGKDRAEDGELRWFVMLDGKEVEWMDGDPFEHKGEILYPQSRTFFSSRLRDNPFLFSTGYEATLQGFPEPLRSQMLHGDFAAGMRDGVWQVIPSEWVREAQARWKRPAKRPELSSLGVDVARGGDDETIIARCTQELWFDELLEYPGKDTPDGPTTAAYIIAGNPHHAPIHIDVIGVGAAPYDFLREANQEVYGINVAEAATATDKSGKLTFKNLRSQLWWQFRELLDPANGHGVALPPGDALFEELTAPTWALKGKEVYVESRDDIAKRIGRSPDRATAVILAAIRTPSAKAIEVATRGAVSPQRYDRAASRRQNYDPYGDL